jgi:uncharacterized protein YigE (DUF2233 family)
MAGWARLFAGALALVGLVQTAQAVTCEAIQFDGNAYTICQVDPETENLRLFLGDAEGTPYGHFTALQKDLRRKGRALKFAMNAGMYHDDRAPVGHYVEEGKTHMRVIPNAGPGNFGLLPNGIFCLRQGRADVFETRQFLANKPDCSFATQSGPMLVIDGELHPRFLPDSTSRYIRNGVGTSRDGKTAVFAISDNTVTFHEFARLFRDHLSLPNALFFDGNVSRLYAPDIDRWDGGRRMGPVVGVTEDIN